MYIFYMHKINILIDIYIFLENDDFKNVYVKD